jgi:hypothetical protein
MPGEANRLANATEGGQEPLYGRLFGRFAWRANGKRWSRGLASPVDRGYEYRNGRGDSRTDKPIGIQQGFHQSPPNLDGTAMAAVGQ